MRPSVLIIEDSPSTADLARWALLDLALEVEVANSASRALDLLAGRLSPRVVVVDAYLPGVPALPFFIQLRQAAPQAAMVLLAERGVLAPAFNGFSAQLIKPLAPRRFCQVVTELIGPDTSEPPVGA
jgi:CheY-like chemotaxis protein